MKSSSKKGLQIDVGKNRSLVLTLCSAFHVISVWKPCSEIRAKTVKTRVLGSSLSSPRPSAAILVSERSDLLRSDADYF